MRRYDEQVDVRRGTVGMPVGVPGRVPVGLGGPDVEEGPCEFLWRGRLWQVRGVVAHWVETGPWWTAPGVRAVIGAEGSSQEAVEQAGATGRAAVAVAMLDDVLDDVLDRPLDPPGEREVWRVEAHVPPRPARPPLSLGEPGSGVFDLVLSRTTGCWRLTSSRIDHRTDRPTGGRVASLTGSRD